jgi:hypothetical protein
MAKKADLKQEAQEQARAGLPDDADHGCPTLIQESTMWPRPGAWTQLASWDARSQPRVQISRNRHCHGNGSGRGTGALPSVGAQRRWLHR